MSDIAFDAPQDFRILVVDDEPDIAAVTKLSLKGMRYRGKKPKLLSVETGQAAVEAMRAQPDIAVILLDVVMETETAGLDACAAIRGELGNNTVRILLRTGQPGLAPERKTIESYDIDGYLAKAELTSARLYTAVRTALKAWEELVELQRHRASLAIIHDLALSLHAFEPLETSLTRMLETAATLCSAELAVLYLETITEDCNNERYTLHYSASSDDESPLATGKDQRAADEGQAAADELCRRVLANEQLRALTQASVVNGSVHVPLIVHRELGHGWIHLAGAGADLLTLKALDLLAGHAGNALYAGVAMRNLENREGELFDNVAI